MENKVVKDSLFCFLYRLMQTHLPAGLVENMVKSAIVDAEEDFVLQDNLAEYASKLTEELRDGRFKALASALAAAFNEKSQGKLMTKEQLKNQFGLELTEDVVGAIENAYNNMSEEEKQNAELQLEHPSTAMTNDLTVAIEQEEEQKRALENAEVAKEITDELVVKSNVSNMKGIQASLEAIEKLKDLLPSEGVVAVSKILRQEVEREMTKNNSHKSNGVFRRVPSDLLINDEDIIFMTKEDSKEL